MSGLINNPYDTVTSGGGSTSDYWPTSLPYQVQPYINYPYYIYTTPTDCAGDLHVFPCPHCNKCKCGKATVTK